MREELEHIAKIDAYLEGKMSSEELLLFEDALKTNAELSEEVLFQKEANNLLIIGELHALEKKLKKYDYTKFNNPSKAYKYGALGFTGLLLLAGLVIYIFNFEKAENLGFSRKVNLLIDSTKEEAEVVSLEQKASNKNTTIQKLDYAIPKEKRNKNTVKSVENIKPKPVTDTIATKNTSWNKVEKKELRDSVRLRPKLPVVEKADSVFIDTKTFKDSEKFVRPEVVEKNAIDAPAEQDVFSEQKEAINYDLAFSPSRGQLLSWPIEKDFTGSILLYNMDGQIIFKQQFNGFQDTEWDGTTKNGDLILFGVYPIIIRSSNGGQPIQGSVTVVE